MPQLNLSEFEVAGQFINDGTTGMAERMKPGISSQSLNSSPVHCRIQHAFPDVIRIARRAISLAEDKIRRFAKSRVSSMTLQKPE